MPPLRLLSKYVGGTGTFVSRVVFFICNISDAVNGMAVN